MALALYIGYQVIFLVWPVREVLHNSLPPSSAVVVVCEQVIFSLLIHLQSCLHGLPDNTSMLCNTAILNDCLCMLDSSFNEVTCFRSRKHSKGIPELA